MANELALTVSFSYTPSTSGMSKLSPPGYSKTVTMSTQRYTQGVQRIAAGTEALLDTGDIPYVGYLLIKNIDPTNYVELNQDALSTAFTIRLKAGEFALFRVGDGTGNGIYAQANIAQVLLEYYLFSD